MTKAFNLQSLLSTMEVSCLFLGLVVRLKCGEGNECKRPYSNARSGCIYYPSNTLPHPFPPGLFPGCFRSRSQFLAAHPLQPNEGTNFHIPKPVPGGFIRKANTGSLPSLLLNKCVYRPVNSNVLVAGILPRKVVAKKDVSLHRKFGSHKYKGAGTWRSLWK